MDTPIRVEILNTTVRLFPTRRRAIQECNTLTTASYQQHREVNTQHGGWLVHNVVQNTYRDVDGVISTEVAKALI